MGLSAPLHKTGRAYGNLWVARQSLGDYQKAIEYQGKHLKTAIEVGDRAIQGRAYGDLDIAYQSLSEYRKATECHEKRLKNALEFGDRAGEKKAY